MLSRFMIGSETTLLWFDQRSFQKSLAALVTVRRLGLEPPLEVFGDRSEGDLAHFSYQQRLCLLQSARHESGNHKRWSELACIKRKRSAPI